MKLSENPTVCFPLSIAAKSSSRRRATMALALAAAATSGAWFGPLRVDADSTTSTAPVESMSPAVQRAVSSANDLSTAFREVSKSVLPSVVQISVEPETKMVRTGPGARRGANPFGGGNPFRGTPFEDMFNDPNFRMQPGVPGGRGPMRRGRGGLGSGVIIDSAGVILTNNHVVGGGGKVIVTTSDGSKYEATEVLTDPETDIAIVRIDADESLDAAPLGDSDAMEVGDWVLALGQPFGLDSTVTAGIISAKQRSMPNARITERDNFLQTDAAINPGNSGGPLVNLRGEVIGINTAIKSSSGGNNGIGFAVPSNMARWVSEQLLTEGDVRRAYLGVIIQEVDDDLADALGVSPLGGVAVAEVMPNTPAAEAGLQPGDVIVRFAGQPVARTQELQLLVEKQPFGKPVAMEVVRDRQTIDLKFTPAERPDELVASRGRSSRPGDDEAASEMNELGLAVSPIDPKLAEQIGVEDGDGVMITEVSSGSLADDAGLRPGMVIRSVNFEPVSDPQAFTDAIDQADDKLVLLIKTPNGSRLVSIVK